MAASPSAKARRQINTGFRHIGKAQAAIPHRLPKFVETVDA